ncbi:Fanconi anemia group M protein isoform X2 [Solenopsis invicta]|uniref:Fanconi anemia group M protein isoform X2 n=1 Tax=Solenopsis invicta TaxID=13686 RepID=UPI000E33D4B6|nr:Fanconi anemia group M protein isoform X2 [Solenopsis invicta]
MESQSIISQNTISRDPETKGFDLSAGNTWIYPENYPVRQYQYNIVKSALDRNTMVCLPTGLGKTFIAAVVMYNFWRWYPYGKIIFLAPTKPLVAQQIEACYEVMGIPSADMIELTGAITQKNRDIAWLKKRIIFATPQVFHNDLERSIIPSHLIKCIVVDEAHKALGKHSYCECIRILSGKNQYFRVLALSATPGNKIDNVHEVIQNLNISHLELRDENSIDIIPYINKRKVDIILVPLSNELAAFKERYITIMDRHVKFLMQCNVLRGHTANISKGRIFHILKDFKTKTDKSGNYGQIIKTLNILFTMYHAYELMIRHGLRAFCKFYETHSDKKFWMPNEDRLQDLLHDIGTYLGPFPELYPNGEVSEISTDIIFGHNKFYKLKELLEHHFNNSNDERKDTRAIVFVEYREIVNEVYILLLQSKPTIRPQMFVGQAGQKQKQQIKALEDFRSNRVNVLISTSIGEEGLDVGEVDLIICFDVSQHSPTRLVQRMGRTGRKRDGHIIVLVTDGKEHENLKSTLSKRDSLNNKILNTSNISSSLYNNNPRMIPNQFTPECHKIHITVLPKTPLVKDKRKRKNISKLNDAFSMKQKENLSKKEIPNQSSMMKFLDDGKCNEQNRDNTCNILTQLTTQKNKYNNTINPNNVKLLTDDNAGIDFLTLCALKRSEEEISSEVVSQMDTTYIPAPKSIENLFSFIVPNIEIINCSFLDNLTVDNLTQCKDENNSLTQCKNNEDDNIHDNNDYINVDNDNFWGTIRNERSVINNDEIRFEDILDESSDSDETAISHLNQQITDMEIDTEPFTSDMNEDNKIITDVRAELSTNTLDDLEPSIFEDILNESFSSIEEGLEDKDDTSLQNTISPNHLNVFAKTVGEINATHKTDINTLHNKDNVSKTNQNLSASIKFTKPLQTNRFVSIIDEMEDVDFNSDVDLNEFIKYDSNKNDSKCQNKSIRQNKLMCNSKAEESLLSITQAISEIARVKKKVETSRGSSVSKEKSINEDSIDWISVNIKNDIKGGKGDTNSRTDNILSNTHCNSAAKSHNVKQPFDFLDDSDEDSIDWISVNIKNDIKGEKGDTNSRTDNILSNTHCNSAAKSHNVKQPLDFLDDSDEDFLITEVNAKKFNELESSYFRNLSKDFKDDIICMPSTSKNSGIINDYFDNESKNLNTKDNYSDNTSRSLKPCGQSTPKRDIRSKLSLRRNKAQQGSDTTELSVFKKSNKYVNNATDKSIFKSNSANSDAQKQMAQQSSDTIDLSVFRAPNKYVNNVTDRNILKSDTRKQSFPSNENLAQKKSKHKFKRENIAKNEFIDDEVKVDSDVSSDEDVITDDEDLKDFVSYTQFSQDQDDMHAHYLRTIKSPIKRPGAFHFREPRSPDPDIQIYSQLSPLKEDSYVNDSFCVAGDAEPSTLVHNDSLLDKMERELEQNRRKRHCTNKDTKHIKKKKTNILNYSVSSEDEIEQLRIQVQD